jgi:hypothetical protein
MVTQKINDVKTPKLSSNKSSTWSVTTTSQYEEREIFTKCESRKGRVPFLYN